MILKGFLKKELIQSFRNPSLVFALLVMPIVQVAIISYTISNEAKNLKIAVVAKPNDYLMHRIYDRALASKYFLPAQQQHKIKDPVDYIKKGAANAVLVAPQGGLSRNLYRGDNSEFQLLIDASNVLIGQSLSGYIKGITSFVLKEELAKHTQQITTPNIVFKTRILFNAEMNTRYFLVPSIMAMVVAMSVVSLICTSFAREKETGTMETLIAAPIQKMHIILGKILPSTLIAFINFSSIWLVGTLLFHLPFRGSFVMLLTAFVVFTCAISMFGLFLSTFCRDQQQAMLALMMSLFVLMMLSGQMFPVETMPLLLRTFAYANPLTHFIFLSRNIILKGCNATYLFQHLYPMVIFGLAFGLLGFKRFKQTL